MCYSSAPLGSVYLWEPVMSHRLLLRLVTKKVPSRFGLQQLNRHKRRKKETDYFLGVLRVGWGFSFTAGLVFLPPSAIEKTVSHTPKARLDSLISFRVPQLADGPQTSSLMQPLKWHGFQPRVSSRFGGNSPRLGTGQPAEGTLCAKPHSQAGFHLHVASFHSIPRRALIL